MDIKEEIKKLPGSPGVYIMKGEKGEALMSARRKI